jgi:hypothetical protein
MISYATLDDIKTEAANPSAPTDVTSLATYNRNLTKAGIYASEVIDLLKHFTFAPLINTRYAKVGGDDVEAYTVILDYPLLSLTSVTLADSASLTVNTDVRAEPRHSMPYRWLQMLNSSNLFTATSSTNIVNEVTITGIWGWHSDYGNAWLASGDAVADVAGLSASVKTITVTDADGVGGDGFIPRFSEGNLIRIDSEYMAITGISSNTLTVARGVRGSTAATHLTAATIDVFQADYAIRRAAAKIAVHNYTRRGLTGRVTFDTVRANPVNVDIPPDALEILANYQLVRFVGA